MFDFLRQLVFNRVRLLFGAGQTEYGDENAYWDRTGLELCCKETQTAGEIE